MSFLSRVYIAVSCLKGTVAFLIDMQMVKTRNLYPQISCCCVTKIDLDRCVGKVCESGWKGLEIVKGMADVSKLFYFSWFQKV